MSFPLKPLSAAAIPGALEKAELYRLLNEPRAAESICLDIIAADPANQRALRTLLLARTDQFAGSDSSHLVERAREPLTQLTLEYERAYYAGIICERRAEAQLGKRTPGAGFVAYEWMREAMEWYEKAEAQRPAGNDDAILRWNTCARLLNESTHVVPRGADHAAPAIGE